MTDPSNLSRVARGATHHQAIREGDSAKTPLSISSSLKEEEHEVEGAWELGLATLFVFSNTANHREANLGHKKHG